MKLVISPTRIMCRSTIISDCICNPPPARPSSHPPPQLSDLERSIEEQQRLVYAATAATLQNEAAVRQLLAASVQTQPR